MRLYDYIVYNIQYNRLFCGEHKFALAYYNSYTKLKKKLKRISSVIKNRRVSSGQRRD